MSEGMTMTLAQAAAAVGGVCQGDGAVAFCRVVTDSRADCAGALFVALRGARFDAHDFVAQAAASGALAALVEHPVAAALPQIVCADTRLALGRLGHAWRAAMDVQVVGVTGSNGKTTVKEMIAAILTQQGPVLATQGNLNNDIGVPLTLLRLQPQHRYAVIEMGANHAGEIAYLTELARPDVAVITNAGAAHLEGFGSLEGVARAKGEIYGGLSAQGVAVINRDDAFAGYWQGINAGRRCIGFGLDSPAEVGASWQGDAQGSRIRVRAPGAEFDVSLALPGRHNVLNALAAASAALALGIAPGAIAAGLASMQPVRGRLQRRAAICGAWLIDDTYNANPNSLRVAIEVLASCQGERFLALGDMAELGEEGARLHAECGELARRAGIERLYATGPLSRLAAQSFGAQGRHFEDKQALIEALTRDLRMGVTLLVKGSRSSRMEDVVKALTLEERSTCC